MRVALVHDWLTGMRGGEKVLEAIAGIYPQADIFTLVHVRGSVSPLIESRRIRTSFIQRLPAAPDMPATTSLFHGNQAVRLPMRPRRQSAAGEVSSRPGAALCCLTPCGMPGTSSTSISGPPKADGKYVYRPVMSWLARWDGRRTRPTLRGHLRRIAADQRVLWPACGRGMPLL
jgi:hypothetical protein